MLYLIEDATPEPAQFGALPALFARTLNVELCRAGVHFDEQRFPDAHQHITADGRLLGSDGFQRCPVWALPRRYPSNKMQPATQGGRDASNNVPKCGIIAATINNTYYASRGPCCVRSNLAITPSLIK